GGGGGGRAGGGKRGGGSRAADTTRKKLKYVKYSPKSVAPLDAARPSARTSRTDRPSAIGSRRVRSAAATRLRASPTDSLRSATRRTDVRSPKREPHSRRPTSNGMNAFGVVRNFVQYSSSTGRIRRRS